MDNQQIYAGNNFRVYKYDQSKYVNRRMGSPRHYIQYITKGNVRYVTAQKTYVFHQGDFYYLPMGMSYESYTWGPDGYEVYSCGFELFPEARTKKFKIQFLPKEFLPEFQQIPLNILPDTHTLVSFYTLLEKLLPYMEEEEAETLPLLETLSRVILDNPTDRIPALARQCGLAESTLYVHIKKLTGKTPNEYRMDVLMAEAIRLLASTDIPVHAIAEQLGFSSVNYFRQQFKLHTSASPTFYRKRGKLENYG